MRKSKLLMPWAVSVALTAFALTGCVIDDDYDDDDDEIEVSSERVTTYRTGYVTSSLPTNYVVRNYENRRYYVVDDNIYFTESPQGYVVVDPPVTTSTTVSNVAGTTTVYRPGYTVQSLPAGATVRRYRGVDYYTTGDVYYRRQPNGYVVVESPF